MTDNGPPELLPASLFPSTVPVPGIATDSPRPPGACGEPFPAVDDHDRQQEELLNALVRTIHHFHGGIRRLFAVVDDPRQATKVKYPLISLLTVGLLMFVFRLGARRDRSRFSYGLGAGLAR